MERRPLRLAPLAAIAVAAVSLAPPTAEAGYERTFEAGSLIVPMDLAYQDHGMLQAYGLVFQLLRQGVTVYWVIDEDKTWHDAPCDTTGDECAWDCAEEGSGVKCPYPTASPDFFAGSMVLWDDSGSLTTGTTISEHGYRGGPFVVDAAEADAARAIIEAWNDPDAWADEPWAEREDPQVVSVHETTEAFTGNVRKEMVQAPTIAVFSDGNEDIATEYLRAAGIRQSNGAPFPADKCGDGDCGPGTANPDMLTVESIMGDMGTCDAPNTDHRNGALFDADGNPAYCQIMSMHWDVKDRETVECDGGDCPATREECAGETFTYHGHEVVAEVRQFLGFPTHFFAECQAVNAYENTVPNPEWPYLDDDGRRGHFLTTTGNPPDCACDSPEGDFECVPGYCDDGARDCCQPSDDKEAGAGFLIADQPNSDTLQVLNPGVPYNQMDGAFDTVGGSEPAYNLSTFLDTRYKNDRDVTFITGPEGPGDQDVWMTGFMDGECDIVGYDEFAEPGECELGKVSYLGGHRYDTGVPISDNASSQGTRLFLNALFEAACVTGGLSTGPEATLTWSGRRLVPTAELPVEEPYTLSFGNTGPATAMDAVLTVTAPSGLEITSASDGGTIAGDTVTWDLGSLAPDATDTRELAVRFTEAGSFAFEAVLAHADGEVRVPYTVEVAADRDGDGVSDADDPAPDDPNRCGDSDSDGCDDCTSGTFDPARDCAADGGRPGDGGGPGGGSGDGDGCGCRLGAGRGGAGGGLALLAVVAGALLLRRRRRSPPRRP